MLLLGPDKLQISVVTFSTAAHNVFYLNAYPDKADLLTAMKNVPYIAGNCLMPIANSGSVFFSRSWSWYIRIVRD